MAVPLRKQSTYFFRPERIQGKYDAIIIGSGIGGLSVAALLAKAGRRVLVLERHYTVGGFTHTFRRKNFEWDVGIHYVGEFHREGSLPNRLMNDLTDGQLQWAPMSDVYDRIIFPDRSYDFVAGRERFIDELARVFPKERQALVRYVTEADQIYASALRFFQHKALPEFLRPFTRRYMCREFSGYARQTTSIALRRFTQDENLIGVLAGQWGTYGLPPSTSSYAMHGVVASHYFDGAAYPIGGSERIAAGILPTIEAAGGQVLSKADVAEILVRSGRVRGVRLADGHEIGALKVVSDVGVHNTFSNLLPKDDSRRSRLMHVTKRLQRSTGHICLYVGLSESADKLGLGTTNLWIYSGYDHDKAVEKQSRSAKRHLPVAYISFPSAKDPDWQRRRGDCATIQVISLVPFEWFERWQSMPWQKRGELYDELKGRLSDQLLHILYEHLPQVQGKVEVAELSTPLSTRHFGNWGHGEIYGLACTPERFAAPWLKPRSPIKGLYLTGQDIVAHGLVGGLYSGLVTASAILGRNVLSEVEKRAA